MAWLETRLPFRGTAAHRWFECEGGDPVLKFFSLLAVRNELDGQMRPLRHPRVAISCTYDTLSCETLP